MLTLCHAYPFRASSENDKFNPTIIEKVLMVVKLAKTAEFVIG